MLELMDAGEFNSSRVGRMVISDVLTPRTRIELNRRLYERVRTAATDVDVDPILVEERAASDHLDGSTFTSIAIREGISALRHLRTGARTASLRSRVAPTSTPTTVPGGSSARHDHWCSRR
jgi:hypothetical protein